MRLPRGCGNTLLVSTLFLFSHGFLASAEVLADGLEIVSLDHVQCERPTRNGDNLRIHYNGTLENGKTFDSSYSRNQPFTFKLGFHRVIVGWDEGLLGMCVGEERKLIIPPELAYGNRPMGPIPAGSTLIFETKLIAIVGVVDAPPVESKPTSESDPASESNQNQESDKEKETHAGSQDNQPGNIDEESKATDSDGSSESTNPEGVTNTEENEEEQQVNDGECRLLGPFALIVQGGLGLLALLSLVWKRHRERPRRPMKIWFFDVSKQVFGSVLLHMVNLLMSMLSSGEFELKSKTVTSQLKDANGQSPNPCSFYLLNLAIDTTIGIPVLVILLRLLHHGAALTPLARPLESIKSGHYGSPPKATWWLKQSFIYFVGLLLMKLFVFFIFQILPWIAWVGDWALRWTEGSEALQITFVMFVFPLIMNAIQYYIIDSVIKEGTGNDSHPNDHEPLPTEDPGDDDDEHGDGETERTGMRRGTGNDTNAYSSSRNSFDPETRKREVYDEFAEYNEDEDDNEHRGTKRGNNTVSTIGRSKGKDIERNKSR